MKSYEETIASVFEKGDAILESKKIRASRIRRITLAVSGVCAAAAVGLFAVYSTTAKDTGDLAKYGDSTVSVTEPAVTATTVSGAGVDITTHIDSSHTTAAVCTTATVTLSAAAQNGVTAAAATASSANADSSSSGGKSPAVSSGTSQKPITTDIKSDDEGSSDMKKIAAFATAFLAALSNSPLSANADTNYNYRMYGWDADEKEVIAQIANGQNDIDLNSDGKFDIADCYELYLYTDGYAVDDAVKSKIEQVCDFDKDGTIFMFSDAYLLMKYYIITNPLDTSVFDANNFDARAHSAERQAEIDEERARNEAEGWDYEESTYTSNMYFASNLKYLMRLYGTGYGFMAGKADSGAISLDVNDDGVFDIKDCVDYEVFVENLLYNDPVLYERYGSTLVQGVVNWNQDDMFWLHDNTIQGEEACRPCDFDIIQLPEETIERCAELFGAVTETGGKFTGRYMTYCYLRDNPLNEAYFTKEFFERYYPGASNYEINLTFIFAARTMDNVAYVNSLDKDKFAADFKQYCQDIEDGRKSVPDLNFDGVIDEFDYDASMLYLRNTFFPRIGETEEEFEELSPFTQAEWDNYAENCDIDGNGKSGETYDIVLIQCYILLNNDDVFNKSASEEINISEEFHSNLALLNAIDIERSGDSNLDGKMDLADAIFIMQANANPNKYEMTSKGRFNGDVEDTGNGITLNDANHIQMVLVGLAE